jgi:5-methyltetrahydropteroyltriglutamate--homocysteine methyltransferase
VTAPPDDVTNRSDPMLRSEDHIVVTHVGSLPRPPDLLDMLMSQERGEPVDQRALSERIARAADEIVEAQTARGIEVVNDGEVGKTSFLTYVNDRLGGFEPMRDSAVSPWAGSREERSFPDFYATGARSGAADAVHMVCVDDITYTGTESLERDIAGLLSASGRSSAHEAFMTSISPTNVEGWQRNEHYKSQEEFLFAIADAMRVEYEAIVGAGLLLQVDDPGLLTEWALRPEWSVEDCRAWARVRVEALNHALRNIPPDRIRFHTCYSINMGPRVHDMELRDIVDLVLDINAGAYSFEAANPRHEHEWRVWRDAGLPEDKLIIPGVITHSSVLVEHPDTVADRIVRFADVVGRERVLAGADCGFASFASTDELHPSIVWAKLEALSEGARRASARLWAR